MPGPRSATLRSIAPFSAFALKRISVPAGVWKAALDKRLVRACSNKAESDLKTSVVHAGKVLTHPRIMDAVWGPGHREKVHYLHVYMTHLREKIEANPAKPELLVTEPRVGYRMNLMALRAI